MHHLWIEPTNKSCQPLNHQEASPKIVPEYHLKLRKSRFSPRAMFMWALYAKGRKLILEIIWYPLLNTRNLMPIVGLEFPILFPCRQEGLVEEQNNLLYCCTWNLAFRKLGWFLTPQKWLFEDMGNTSFLNSIWYKKRYYTYTNNSDKSI
jgi:hypothetical protein